MCSWSRVLSSDKMRANTFSCQLWNFSLLHLVWGQVDNVGIIIFRWTYPLITLFTTMQVCVFIVYSLKLVSTQSTSCDASTGNRPLFCFFKHLCLIKIFFTRPPEHQNYFGFDDNLGPVAVSIRRERLDDGKEKDGMQFNHRVTFRTSQVTLIHRCALFLLCLLTQISVELCRIGGTCVKSAPY